MILAELDWSTVVAFSVVAVITAVMSALASTVMMSRVLATKVDALQKFDADLSAKIEKLVDALSAEREARHTGEKDAADRAFSVAQTLAADYAPRRETLSQFGSLVQRLDVMRQESTDRIGQVVEKIEALPCKNWTGTGPGGCPPMQAAQGRQS